MSPKSRKDINVIVLLFLSVLFFFVGKEFLLELALLRESEHVTGTTTGYGPVFGLGKGIKFEYEVNGEKFVNCNTYYPISKDSIKVPAGKYSVRVAKKFPEKGRMDFKKEKIGEDNITNKKYGLAE